MLNKPNADPPPITTPADAPLGGRDLRALYEQHTPFLRSAVVRLVGPGVDADDVLQEVFIIALRRPEKLGAASSARAWLYGVAVHVARKARRKARLRSFLSLGEAASVTTGKTPLDEAERSETRRLINATLEKLSDRRRTTFILFELEGLSGEEIAAIEKCSVNTVWTRLHHARRDFVRHLKAVQKKAGGR